MTENSTSPNLEFATFAAGCFWGVEEAFRIMPGVISTEVGYTGGHTENPTYRDVCSKGTGHAEVVRVEFDPNVTTFDVLLAAFFELHDPTQVNRQGPDVGDQYRTAVFYHSDAQREATLRRIDLLNHAGVFPKPIATQVVPAVTFYTAEEYHQKYLHKRGLGSCHI